MTKTVAIVLLTLTMFLAAPPITAAAPPTVTTSAATAITAATATLSGSVNPNGVAATARFEYGLTTSYGAATPAQSMGAGNTNLSIGGGAIAGLTCGTVYHFRATATSADGTTNGSDLAFSTNP